MDNARLYETEHAAAATLQHSLLPAVPHVPGLQVAARYLVGMDGNQVGGDWYDVLNLPDGAVGVAVGDVVGHDLRAAAAMGQLRGVLRSYAWDGGPPGSVLDRCDQLVQGLEMAAMATAVYARLEPPDATGDRLLRYANAGHPTPLLLGPDGTLLRLDAQPLADDRGGARASAAGRGPGRTEASVRCAPGSVLVLYTDGLTDIAGEDADERTALLERTVAGLRPGCGRGDGGRGGHPGLRAVPDARRRGPAGVAGGALSCVVRHLIPVASGGEPTGRAGGPRSSAPLTGHSRTSTARSPFGVATGGSVGSGPGSLLHRGR